MGLKKLDDQIENEENVQSEIPKGEPVGLFRRGLVYIVDGLLISIPLACVIFILAGSVITGLEELKLITAPPEGKTDSTHEMVSEIISAVFVIGFGTLWYGWFNKNKGGSPGKILAKMQLINTKTGENLTYAQTFMRDVLFKVVFAMAFTELLTFLVSEQEAQRLGVVYYFIIAIFIAVRKDKKGLHDILCNTQVIRRPKK